MQDKHPNIQPVLEALKKVSQKDLAEKAETAFSNILSEIDRKESHILNLHRELRQVKETLEGVNEIRNEFISVCAHDLRSPLSGMMSFIEILKMDGAKLPQREIDDIYRRIEKSGSHMLSLINDLLDLGNIDSGKINIAPEPIFLSHVCKEAIDYARGRMESKQIQAKLEISSSELRVKMDPQKAMQILNNLISNAIKFTPRGGTVTLKIQPKDRHIELEVRDSGQGIPPEEIDKIFERFQKTSTVATEGEKGSGLGLSIVHQLVTLQKGKIQVKSKVGEGTSFLLTFPVAESSKLLDLFSGKQKNSV